MFNSHTLMHITAIEYHKWSLKCHDQLVLLIGNCLVDITLNL